MNDVIDVSTTNIGLIDIKNTFYDKKDLLRAMCLILGIKRFSRHSDESVHQLSGHSDESARFINLVDSDESVHAIQYLYAHSRGAKCQTEIWTFFFQN